MNSIGDFSNNLEEIKISVISDTHVLPEEMIFENDEFIEDFNSDRKLFIESEGLFKAALSSIDKNSSDIIFITGDLTKDGEYRSHQLVSSILEDIKSKKEARSIFVIPGNHDINNINARDYNFESKGRTNEARRTTPKDFLEIYSKLMSDKIISYFKDSEHFKKYINDTNLNYKRNHEYSEYAHGYNSYAARVTPVNSDSKGITIIGLDTCKYSIESVIEKIDGLQNTDGRVTYAQFKWLVEMAEEANNRNDLILVLSHHAFIPHFNNQENLMKPYIIDDWNLVISSDDPRINGKMPYEILADNNMHFLFTGHMHAQDIAKNTSGNNNIMYDIETGSTLTYPLPIRNIKVQINQDSNEVDKVLDIKTDYIKSFTYKDLKGKDIKVKDAQSYAKRDLITHDLMLSGIKKVLPVDLKIRDIIKKHIFTEDIDQWITDYIVTTLLNSKKPFRGKVKLLQKNKFDVSIFVVKSLKNSMLESSEHKKNLELRVLIGKRKFTYLIRIKRLKQLVTNLLDEIDKNILSEREIVFDLLDAISEKMFDVDLNPEAIEIFTLSQAINEAYITHLKGDEIRSEYMDKILNHFEHNSLTDCLLVQLVPEIKNLIETLSTNINYNMKIKKIVKQEGSGIIGAILKKYIVSKIGSNLSKTLKGFKIDIENLIYEVCKIDSIEKQLKDLDVAALSMLRDMTSEEEPAYQQYKYVEDNDTILKI